MQSKKVILSLAVTATAIVGAFATLMPPPYYAVKPAGTGSSQPQACISVTTSEECISTGTNPFCTVNIVKYDGTILAATVQDDQLSTTTCATPLRRVINP